MKSRLCCIACSFVLLILPISEFAQTTTTFRMNYNIALLDLPGQVVESNAHDGYLFAGSNLNFIPVAGTVTKVNPDATVAWSKRYWDGSLSVQLQDIKADASASNYYLCGGSSNNAGVFLKIDESGNILVCRKFDYPNNGDGVYLNRMVKTTDGGYIACGYVEGHDPDGAGPEIKFNPLTNNDPGCTESSTEYIGSPLIVKFDVNGAVVWHRVFRFYKNAGLAPADRIYNDGSFTDCVEISDGYMFVGSYDVNDVFSNFDSDDCDDATSKDALILKTDLNGNIIYFRQIDNPSTTATAPSKYLNAIAKTASGLPIITGSDGQTRPCILMQFPGSGAWGSGPYWVRKYGATTFFGVYDPFEPSSIMESADGCYVIMGMYIRPLAFSFTQFLLKINPVSFSQQFCKSYAFSLAVILPYGSMASDGGFVSLSTTMGGGGFDYHVIKTDPAGLTASTCSAANITTSNAGQAYTWGTPYYNSWTTHTVDNAAFGMTANAIVPGSSIQCVEVLPVEILNFTGRCQNKMSVSLEWATASETDNDYFTIERSDDEENFISLATVDGAGNSNMIVNYSYTDFSPNKATTYYRLKQTDYNGNTSYSSAIAVDCDSDPTSGITYFPNPFEDEIIMMLDDNASESALLEVFDVLGKIVLVQNLNNLESGQVSYKINCSELSAGMYYFRFTTEKNSSFTKVIKR